MALKINFSYYNYAYGLNTPILEEYAGQTKYHFVEWFQGHFRIAFVNVKAASTVMLTMYQSSTIALG